jgi:importin subunit beta-1
MRELVLSLERLQSVDTSERNLAESRIMEMARRDFHRFLLGVLELLGEHGLPETTRIAGGLVLRSFFVGGSAEKKKEVLERWMSLKGEERSDVKKGLVGLLDVPSMRVGSTVAQCIAALAKVEISVGGWSGVFRELAGAASAVEGKRIAAIEALGMLCGDAEGIDDSLITSSSGHILTAIIGGMGDGSVEVQRAAVEALKKSMEFIAFNMEIEEERSAIIGAIYMGCKSEEIRIAPASLECMNRAIDMYYGRTAEYIRLGFADLSLAFLRAGEEEKVLAALEFWSIIACVENSLESDPQNKEIIKDAYPVIIPEILRHIRKDESLEESVEWNPSKASASVLSAIAWSSKKLIRDKELLFREEDGSGFRGTLVDYIVNRIEQENTVWTESGMVMLGSVINENTADVLHGAIRREMKRIISLLKSEFEAVQDSAIWLIEKIFAYVPSAVEEGDICTIMERIFALLRRCDKISTNAAWALLSILDSTHNRGKKHRESPLDMYLQQTSSLLTSLIASLRPNDFNLRAAMFAALTEVVKVSSEKHLFFVLSIAEESIAKIKILLVEERMDSSVLEDHICSHLGVLQEALRVCHPLVDRSRDIVEICTYLLGNPAYVSVFTDVYLTLTCLADVLGIGFGNFDAVVIPLVLRDLAYIAEDTFPDRSATALFATSLITFVGALASAVQLGFGLYVRSIVPLLFNSLNASGLPKEAKPAIVSTFADIALGVGKMFDPYIELMFSICLSISSLSDIEEDYLTALRESLLDLFSCIMHSSSGKNDLVSTNVPVLLSTVHKIVTETTDRICVVKSLNLISDIAKMYGSTSPINLSELQNTWVLEFIAAKADSTNTEVREAAINARFQIGVLDEAF